MRRHLLPLHLLCLLTLHLRRKLRCKLLHHEIDKVIGDFLRHVARLRRHCELNRQRSVFERNLLAKVAVLDFFQLNLRLHLLLCLLRLLLLLLLKTCFDVVFLWQVGQVDYRIKHQIRRNIHLADRVNQAPKLRLPMRRAGFNVSYYNVKFALRQVV